MKQAQKILIFLSLHIAVAITSLQATTLSVNSIGDLEVRDAQSQLVTTLTNGTISKTVKADNQAFKISYGKDLKNRLTSIIYPDPDKPQNISLNIYGQDVQISSDAVLTIVADSDMSMVTMQSGILGKVTVAGSELGRSSSVQVKNGSVVAYTPPAATPLNVMPPAMASKPSSDPSGISSFSPSDMSSTASAARRVEGDVMIAPAGVDVVDAVRSSSIPPRLSEGATISPGSTVQTGPTGQAFISPFPGAVVVVKPNSIVKFEEIESTPGNKKLVAYVRQGGVVSIIKGINPSELDYRIKSPHGVAAARGTIYSVDNNGPDSTAVVNEGVIVVTTFEGSKTINVDSGNETTYPKPDGEEEEKKAANGNTLAKNQALANQASSFLGSPSSSGSPNPSGPPNSPTLPTYPPSPSPDLTPAPMTPVGP